MWERFFSIKEEFLTDIDGENINGYFRDLREYFPWLAKFYLNKDTAYKRDSSSPSLSRNCCLQDFIQYGGRSGQGEGKPVNCNSDI